MGSQDTTSASNYQIGQVIGFGSSAVVHVAIHKPTGQTVAIKMIELDRFERNQIDELHREIHVMTLCKHPHILTILEAFVDGSKLWISMPFMKLGSCLDIMKTSHKDGLPEDAIANILYQTLQGLEYLHKNGHIHRDIKAGNLLMDEKGVVKLGDFGVSSSLSGDGSRKGTRKTFVGTPCWMAPEVMEVTKGYNHKADIWSFGITALELAYGSAPFAKYPPMKVIYLTLTSGPPGLDRNKTKHKYSKQFKEMIDQCLQKDPNKRPGAEALLKHGFFRNVDIKGVEHSWTGFLDNVPDVCNRTEDKRSIRSEIPVKKGDTAKSWDFEVESGNDGSKPADDLGSTIEIKKGRFSVIGPGGSNMPAPSPETTYSGGNTVASLAMMVKTSQDNDGRITPFGKEDRKSRFEVLTAEGLSGTLSLFAQDRKAEDGSRKPARPSRFKLDDGQATRNGHTWGSNKFPFTETELVLELVEARLSLTDQQKAILRELFHDKRIFSVDAQSAHVLVNFRVLEAQICNLLRENESLKSGLENQ